MMIKYLTIFVLAVAVCSCTTDRPTITPVNGHSAVQTMHRFLGMPVWTSNDEARTAEQEHEKIEIDKERREVDLDLVTEERQSAFAFWLGSCCFGFAAVCVIAGYFFHGWKFWGGLSMTLAGIGAVAWGAEHLVGYLKWVVVAAISAIVLWSMWKLRDFNGEEIAKEAIKKKVDKYRWRTSDGS